MLWEWCQVLQPPQGLLSSAFTSQILQSFPWPSLGTYESCLPPSKLPLYSLALLLLLLLIFEMPYTPSGFPPGCLQQAVEMTQHIEVPAGVIYAPHHPGTGRI